MKYKHDKARLLDRLYARLAELGLAVQQIDSHGLASLMKSPAGETKVPAEVSLDHQAQLARLKISATISIDGTHYTRLPAVDETQLIVATVLDQYLEETTRQTVDWLIGDVIELLHDKRGSESLGRELIHSYEELSLLYRCSSNMSVGEDPLAFLRQACEHLSQITRFKWLALQTQNHSPKLGNLRDQIIKVGTPGCSEEQLKEIGSTLMMQRPFGGALAILDNPRAINHTNFPGQVSHMLVIPMVGDGQVLGMLFAGSAGDNASINSQDAKLCNSLAGTLAMFLENVTLYQESQEMYQGILRALTAAIDAKDSYTHGHSERVALLARQLAESCGADELECEQAYLAGLVHDVGKIGVPESVLCNPGLLSEGEFASIRLHPTIGAHILEGIPSMQPLLPGVLHHHERWDGQGYPHGLAGRDIPILGRWIALADSFDAMSSDRAYRARMPRRQVLDEIRSCAGSQFDPDLTARFLEMDFSRYDRVMSRHIQRGQSLAG